MATGRCAYNEIVAEPLTMENQEAWFVCVKNFLLARDLWEVVEGTANLDENAAFWRRKNAEALHIIQISCSPESFSHIKRVSEAKAAWHSLNLIYKKPDEDSPEPPMPPEGNPIQNEDFPEPPMPLEGHLIQNEDSPKPPMPQEDIVMEKEKVDIDVAILCEAILDNNWCRAKETLEKHPEGYTAKLTSSGKIVLHIAALFGQVEIVEELVKLVPEEYLEIVDNFGKTPLIFAALSGVTRIVECMVNKNRKTLSISAPNSGSLPVAFCFGIGHKEAAHYLYSVTPLEDLKPDKGPSGLQILYNCFNSGDLGVACDLLQRCEELLFASDSGGWTPIEAIAAMSYAFPSGSQLIFWKQWIYKYIHIPSTTTSNDIRVDIQQQDQSKRVRGIHIQSTTTTNHARVDSQQQDQSKRVQGVGLPYRLTYQDYNFLGMKKIYELKLLHSQATQILSLVCKKVSTLQTAQQRDIVTDALFRAARAGNVEFVVEIVKANPDLILMVQRGSLWDTFFFAVQYRQAEVFNLIHGLRFKIPSASLLAASGNSMLHVAGMLAPSSQLNRIPGAALQMQREMQWFKEVESVVPPAVRLSQNHDGKQPEEICKESHKDLRKEGEEWIKGTASSCSVVGALVVTIMFAAAFTVPGGNNQEFGYPIFLEKKLFMLFIISDALSLFSSTTSVLMFLGILTSRYLEEDFLKSLPTKLIIGLSSLFLSIAAMMIAFSATILIMLEHRHSGALLPIIMLASVPVTLFALLQFPLLVQIIYSTYGPSIFNRNVKPWPYM